MTFITLIPTRRKDGSQVSRDERHEILDWFIVSFGGYTIDGFVRGVWSGPSGEIVPDVSMKVSVACPPERIVEAMELVRRVGRRLEQVEMYFEVRDFGVAFLEV